MSYKDPEKRRLYKKELYSNRRSLGLCGCGRKTEENRSQCSICNKRSREWASKTKLLRISSRLCGDCGLNNDTDTIYCVNCTVKRRKYGQKFKISAIKAYGNKCACCGEMGLVFLCIDHIDGNGTKHRNKIGRSKFYKWLKENDYPKGFQVLCWNCNSAKYIDKICPHQYDRMNYKEMLLGVI